MDKRLSKAISATLFGALMGSTTLAGASGFAIIEHGAQGQGNAYASGGATAEDASSMWFNPASLSRLGSQTQSSANLIVPSFEFTDGGSTQAVSPTATRPLLPTASSSGDGGDTAVVPNFYYTRKINDKYNFGLAVNAPFGLSTSFDPEWKGRYQAIDSRITTLNVNPAISYKVNNQLTFGAGVNANYIDARITKRIDFTAACLGRAAAAEAAPGFPLPAGTLTGSCTGAAAGPGAGGNDGRSEIRGKDLSFGFNVGLLYEINNDTRVSVAYRSEIHHKLDDKARFSVPTTISTLGGAPTAIETGLRTAFTNTGTKASLTLPDSISFSAYHRVLPKLAVLGDATWTGWSDIPELRVIFDAPTTLGTGFSVEPLGWQDTWRLALGLHYYHNNRLTLRTGVAYDESPTPSAVLRTPRLPDNDRIWLSFGASYTINNKMSADVGFTHLFISDTNIAHPGGTTGDTLNGVFESHANILSAQFNYKFD